MSALGLPNRHLIPNQTTGFKLLQNDLVCPRYCSWPINIFNAHNPLASMGARIKPTP
jgi:hypothetical protein